MARPLPRAPLAAVGSALLALAAGCGARTGSGPAGPAGGASWRPAATVTWQWQLQGTIETGYDVDLYDVDLFEAGSAIAALHRDGRRVVCYFSAGSLEQGRPDAAAFPAAAIGNQLDGWPDEAWLDHRDPAVREVLAARLDRAASRGCDGVEPDNVDGFLADTGFPLTAADQLDFNRWLADQAHRRGLAVGLKNDLEQVAALEPRFDFALDEECHAYSECELLAPFVAAGKAVLNVEYRASLEEARTAGLTVCPDAAASGLRTLILPLALDDSFRFACP